MHQNQRRYILLTENNGRFNINRFLSISTTDICISKSAELVNHKNIGKNAKRSRNLKSTAHKVTSCLSRAGSVPITNPTESILLNM